MDNKNIINSPVKWMVTIVERGQGQKVAQVFQEYQINIHLVTLGIGTVKSDILDYIGLGGPGKRANTGNEPTASLQPARQRDYFYTAPFLHYCCCAEPVLRR